MEHLYRVVRALSCHEAAAAAAMVLFLFCWALAVLKPKGKLPMSSA